MPLDFAFAGPPAPGQTVPVAPGILWLRMPLPFALDHINLWLIEEGEGWTIVDTGFASEASRTLWDGVFTGPMGGRAPARLVVTHFHPDHMGLADWLATRFALTMETTLAEWSWGRAMSLLDAQAFNAVGLPFYRATGFDESSLAAAAQRGNPYSSVVPRVPSAYARLRAGAPLDLGGRRWEVIVGEGHSPELAALWCEEIGVLISGDQVLPSISPNVSVWPTEPEADPLALYLASLDRFGHIPASALVLPSHGIPFRGLHRRLDEMRAHHDARLDETLAACARPVTATELIPVLFRRQLDRHQLFFAVGEALAHLHRLRAQGLVAREAGADGVQRWVRT